MTLMPASISLSKNTDFSPPYKRVAGIGNEKDLNIRNTLLLVNKCSCQLVADVSNWPSTCEQVIEQKLIKHDQSLCLVNHVQHSVNDFVLELLRTVFIDPRSISQKSNSIRGLRCSLHIDAGR